MYCKWEQEMHPCPGGNPHLLLDTTGAKGCKCTLSPKTTTTTTTTLFSQFYTYSPKIDLIYLTVAAFCSPGIRCPDQQGWQYRGKRCGYPPTCPRTHLLCPCTSLDLQARAQPSENHAADAPAPSTRGRGSGAQQPQSQSGHRQQYQNKPGRPHGERRSNAQRPPAQSQPPAPGYTDPSAHGAVPAAPGPGGVANAAGPQPYRPPRGSAMTMPPPPPPVMAPTAAPQLAAYGAYSPAKVRLCHGDTEHNRTPHPLFLYSSERSAAPWGHATLLGGEGDAWANYECRSRLAGA